MEKNSTIKLLAALAMFSVAGVFLARFFNQDPGVSDKAFFYDESEKKLFTGPRNAIPPIQGLNDTQADAVRAVVISTNGNPADKSSRTIAYVEKYSPELKRQMELAQVTGASPQMGRGLAQAHRFVRRLADVQWFSLDSPEGEKIVGEWLAAGPGGSPAVICTP